MNGKKRSLDATLEIGQWLQTKTFLETLCKIGWTAEARVESGLRDITVLLAKKFKRTL
jgi:hypothetical protein